MSLINAVADLTYVREEKHMYRARRSWLFTFYNVHQREVAHDFTNVPNIHIFWSQDQYRKPIGLPLSKSFHEVSAPCRSKRSTTWTMCKINCCVNSIISTSYYRGDLEAHTRISKYSVNLSPSGFCPSSRPCRQGKAAEAADRQTDKVTDGRTDRQRKPAAVVVVSRDSIHQYHLSVNSDFLVSFPYFQTASVAMGASFIPVIVFTVIWAIVAIVCPLMVPKNPNRG